MSELRLAGRRLRQRPTATLASVVTLACALAGAAATWTLLSAVLLDPLPIPDAARVAAIVDHVTSGPRAVRERARSMRPTGYPELLEIRERRIFDETAASGLRTHLVVTPDGGTQEPVLFASHDYFDVLRVQPSLGRAFTRGEDQRGSPVVAVLSHRYWQTAFGGDAGVLGRRIQIAGQPITVIGVLPRRFRGTSLATAPSLYVPLHAIGTVDTGANNYFAEANHPSSPATWLRPIGRLRTGDSLAGAAARLDALPLATRNSVRVRSFAPIPVGTAAIPATLRDGMRQFTRLLAIMVGLLLLVGSGTVGLLLLVRTEARRARSSARSSSPISAACSASASRPASRSRRPARARSAASCSGSRRSIPPRSPASRC